jgi:hypothetical protein
MAPTSPGGLLPAPAQLRQRPSGPETGEDMNSNSNCLSGSRRSNGASYNFKNYSH